MRRPRSALVLGGGAALLLVSLYLPWLRARDRHPILYLPSVFVSDGWATRNADATALAAVVVMALAAASWMRPQMFSRRALGICAVLAGYLALGLAATIRFYWLLPGDLDRSYVYGAYIGIAAGVLLVAFGLSPAIGGQRSPANLASLVLVPTLLVSFLLPWHEVYFERKISVPAFAGAAAPVAAAFALLLLGGRAPLTAAFGTALFTAGAFREYNTPSDYAYGAWLGLAVAIALLAVTLAANRQRPRAPGKLAVLALGALAVFLVSLFLPWQSVCVDGGPCLVTRGWTLTAGTAAALVAVGFATVLVARARRLPELVAAFALLVTTAGLEVARDRLAWEVPKYGAWIAAGAAAVVVSAAACEWLGNAGRRVPRPHPLPIAACVAYLAVLTLSWWPQVPWLTAHVAFAPLTWPTIAGVLITIALVGLWVRRPSGTAPGLVLLPVGLAFLAVIDIVRWRGNDLWSGSALALAFCAVLAACGWIEVHSGLENLRLPAILRVDRL